MMKKIIIALFSAALAVSCGMAPSRERTTETPPAASQPTAPERYTYTVRNTYPHSTSNYTQGLQYADDAMWEGTGEHGRSKLLRTDLATGKSEVMATLPHSEFGEGITLLGDKIYQLTWTSNIAHVYDRKTLRKTGDFRYQGEGWGLTTDGEKLYMSNGTEYIRTLDPATFRPTHSITVTYEGVPVRYLNEMEWIEGKIWANVYTTDQIVIIDPATGVVEGVVDLTGLLPESEITPQTDVLNGIAYDSVSRRIFVTGKRWSKIFEIEIVKQ